MLLVLVLAVVTVVMGRVPILGWLFYPFQVYGTFVHELSHGLAAILTGGAFRRFAVHPDLSGTATAAGGVSWIVTSAGYLGSAMFGALLTFLSASRVPARVVLLWLGLALGVLSLVFARNVFGIVSGLVLAALLMLAGRRLRESWADALLLFLAVQMMLDALDSVFDLMFLSALRAAPRTDAQIMADATGIPALVWAALWTGVSLVILLSSLRVAYRRTPTPLIQDGVEPRYRLR